MDIKGIACIGFVVLVAIALTVLYFTFKDFADWIASIPRDFKKQDFSLTDFLPTENKNKPLKPFKFN